MLVGEKNMAHQAISLPKNYDFLRIQKDGNDADTFGQKPDHVYERGVVRSRLDVADDAAVVRSVHRSRERRGGEQSRAQHERAPAGISLIRVCCKLAHAVLPESY